MPPVVPKASREVFIQGVTEDGHTFRPSDWAERLAGAMSCFRPDGVRGHIGEAIGYSPYCKPRVVAGIKCVVVNEAIRDIEPRAWDFVMSFARDNRLQVVDACLIPERADAQRAAAHAEQARLASLEAAREAEELEGWQDALADSFARPG